MKLPTVDDLTGSDPDFAPVQVREAAVLAAASEWRAADRGYADRQTRRLAENVDGWNLYHRVYAALEALARAVDEWEGR